MSLEIVQYSDKLKDVWEEFVTTTNNGTIFHERKFLSYHPPDRFKDFSLLFYKEGKIIALFPAVDVSLQNQRILFSHRGASYGGFVCLDVLSIKDAFSMVQALIEYAGKSGFNAIDITPPPQVYSRRPCNYIDFALIQNGFTYRKREISSVIPLDFTRENILTTFNEGSRRAVRRAWKLGTVVRESDDYPAFYKILEKNLRLRHNVTPTHSLEELLKLKKMYPDRIKLFAAFHGEIMVAGVVMFICNARVVLAFYISHNDDFQQYRGVNLLFHDIIDWGISEKFGFLDYGIFTVNEDPNWGLARFKESFGAQGVFRDSLRLIVKS
ncbi:peptidoglycan bridge formation glycyltransferase FemA/FemB family protein [candidate division KSB1 bacterium]|nr:peptidoglycan bridge formation glycyltransferase FemA/FemB family protein [candidate division KSB1 bacterium]